MKKIIRIILTILMITTIVSCKKKDIETIEFSEIKSNQSVRYRVIKKSAAIRDFSSIDSKIVRTAVSGEAIYIDVLSVSTGVSDTVEGKAGRWLQLSDSSTPSFVFSTDVKAEIDLFKPPFRMDNEIVNQIYHYGEDCSGDAQDQQITLFFYNDNIATMEWDKNKYIGKYQKIQNYVYIHFNEIEKIEYITSSLDENAEAEKKLTKEDADENIILRFVHCPIEGHDEMLLDTVFVSKDFSSPSIENTGWYWREGTW